MRRDLQDLLVRRVKLDRLVLTAHRALTELMVHRDLRAKRDRKVLQAQMEQQARKDLQARMVRRLTR